MLETVLEANGLVLVLQGTVAQIFPAGASLPTGQVRFGTDLPDPPPLGIVTQLVPLQSMQADEGAAALRQLASPSARIEPITRSNALLITDRGIHVARYRVLRQLTSAHRERQDSAPTSSHSSTPSPTTWLSR
jgi:general secretion pathway protein D